MKLSLRVLLLAIGLAGVVVSTAPTGLLAQQEPAWPVVQITSPQGRTGLSGKTRIVARIQPENGTTLGPVEFFVDGKLIGKDEDGPPYAVLWNDENPAAPVEIVVSVTDSEGRVGKGTIELKPYQFTFKSGVSSVYLEPSVIDPSGRPINGLTETDFVVLEDGVPQAIDSMTQRPNVSSRLARQKATACRYSGARSASSTQPRNLTDSLMPSCEA